ncbi:ricin-type beta-trefoil lectin domain protein [Streptomyces sp. NPDC001389]|uniref:ricin-type beta-trefoil lectin domain protein n=1 Tax=Streptomyces sp. NPDC001389 TaxID=3364569 RepID=UPI00368FB4FD
MAVLGGLAIQPAAFDRNAALRADPVADAYDWLNDTPAEQWRQYQCLMNDVLRLGGPAMAQTAQDGLNQPQDKLHVLADRKHWEQTPLAVAYKKDRDAASSSMSTFGAQRDAWAKPLAGLIYPPGGMNNADFHWPPGSPGDGKQDFYTQTGLSKWIADRFWTEEGAFYQDPTPKANEQAMGAVKNLGTPLYGKDPDPQSSGVNWNRDLAERAAFKRLTEWSLEPMGADNARLFMASGGFPRTAPEPGTAEYRLAVEDLKARFAGCAWRDPIDPNKVLDGITTTAVGEWQQEIASQQTQRNQILTANAEASAALTAGARALGEMLGNSWVADHATRWQDYWSPGGPGAVGDKPTVIEVHAANGKCLDVENSGTNDGTAVQIWTCNGTAAQKWQIFGDDYGLHLRNLNSYKCLDVSNNDAANGTRIQIWTCNSSPAQTWEYNLRATTSLKNVGTGKCLDLHTYDPGYDAWLWECNGTGPQQFDVKPSGNGAVPAQSEFTKAKAAVTGAQAGAKQQLDVLRAQAVAAKKAATTTDTATQAAYTIADASGAPRGRGLLVGQQKAQVTKGAVAALDAMVKAGETAEAATRASGADSETIAQRALAQAAQAKAEFRREAAHTAELQAKAASEAAKAHRDNAKKEAETAKARLGDAVKAEADAKAAAADARAKRLAAEAQEATAKKEKGNAAAKQGEAAQHRENAQAEATKAQNARTKAEASEATAVESRNGAVKARDEAKAKRDDAWDAEQRAQAERAKADAKATYAASLDAGTEADAARTAATQADQHAKDAETAASKARGEADAATKAAADADSAATRAESAAKRSRADADAAQAAKLKADAAVKTATSAAADAIAASQNAASEARSAVARANEADGKAKTAKTQADQASQEAVKARAASAKAAGFAYVTAQAAVDAGKSASQVARPANDAIQLGSPYVTTDSTATLIVLTGQASKTIAEQQKAIAEAHAKNAQEEAASAKALADTAQADTKAAYQHSANAAGYASEARGYAKEALGYSAEAAGSASLAAASLARTTEYGRQATADAVAAGEAAGRSEGYAKEARGSADQAALDATAARNAAAQAEKDATAARSAADRANTAATEAEQAAKDADKYAKEAQESADRAEKAAKAQQIGTGTVPDGSGGSIGKMFYVVDHTENIGKPETLKKTDGCEGWFNKLFYRGDCTMTVKIRYKAYLDLYLCTAEVLDPKKGTCPPDDTVYLGQYPTDELSQEITHTITMAEYQASVDPVDILFGSWIKCAQKIAPGGENGSWGGCAWAAVDVALLFSGKILRPIAEGITALDAAMRTGIGIADALRGLRSLRLNPEALAAIEYEANMAEAVFTSCKKNSFPADTRVLMADGSHRPIGSLRVGDAVLAGDPATGTVRSEPVTDTFRHTADRLVTISLADGSSLDTTPGHKIHAAKRGWILASELRPGDRLLRPGGTQVTVAGVRSETDAASQQVFDLTVDGLHSFYVRAEGSQAPDVLVHNCVNLNDELLPNLRKYRDSGEMHGLKEHVLPDPAEAFRIAQRKGVPNTVWTSQDIAQQAIDRVLADHFTTVKNGQRVFDKEAWKAFQQKVARARDGEVVLDISGRWTAYESLGKTYHPDGVTITNAGNEVRLKLMKVQGHSGQGRGGFAIMTAFPTGVAP